MKTKILSIFMTCILITCSSHPSAGQEKINYSKKEARNNWGLGFVYSESGFGLSSSLYLPIGKSSDLYFNILFSNVTDSRELDRYDIYGNSIVPYKVNRIFMIPLSIGINKELFKGDLEGEFRPVMRFGVAPTLVLTNPYDRSFFSAISYTTTKFAVGPYGGIGFDFKQSKSMSLNVNLSYYYLPVIGGGLESLENSEISNVGGFQLSIGLNFLK